MAELPSAYPGGFPNPPKSGKMFFRAVSFGKNVYDAVNRRRKRYDRPVPDPPLPPPAPSPSFGDDGSPGLEFLEPVFAPVLKVTEADLSTPDPAPTPVPVTTTTAAATTATGPRPPPTPTPSPSTTTTTTTTSAPRPPPTPTPTPSPSTTTTTTTSAPRPPPTPTPTPSTTTTTTTSAPRPPPTPTPDTTTATTTMGPRPALSPTPTPATTTTTVPRPAPSPTTATPATTRTTSSLTPTPEPALPITATTTTASPTVSIPATTTTDPDITEISLLCRARNALLHVLPDGNRIATYLAFVLAASGVITLVWFLARSSRTGGQEAPKPEPGLGCSLNDAVASKRISYALNQLNCDDTAFCTYSLDELKMATDDFSPEQILSTQDAGEDAPNNVVYHGTIPGLGSVAIKRFRPNAWPDSNGFLKEAFNVGKLRSRRIANLIGCCCQSDERLIVAEFMPYPNLTQNIHGDDNSMTWALRVQIALHLAQALDYCKRNGRALYHRIDSDKILFDEDGNSRLASFGLMKENSDETVGVIPVIGRSLVYSFGLILLELLKKKDLMLSEALDNMRQRDFMSVMDSSLADEARTSDAIQLMQLAYSCLEDNAQEQPNLTKILATLENFQIYESVSDIGKSYASGKINELHDALESDAYSEDELISCKKPSELWSGQPVAITNARKYGDNAFQSKQYSLVVKSYSEIVDSGAVDSPTVLARRSFANVVLGKLKEGLEDARKAGQISPDWPSAYYLEGMALIQLGKLEGHEKIKLGSVLEDKRSRRLEG